MAVCGMIGVPPGGVVSNSFVSAWLTDVTESRTRAVVELIIALGLGLWTNWKWLGEPTTTPIQAGAWMACLAGYVLLVGIVHARGAWNREHLRRVAAERLLENAPRPKLAMEFRARLFAGSLADPKRSIIRLSNAGPEDAFNVTFSDLSLHERSIVRFHGVDRLAKDSTVDVEPDVARFTDDGGLYLEHTDNLNAALIHAHLARRNDGDERTPLRWAIRVSFRDYQGITYYADHELVLDRTNGHADLQWREAGTVRPVVDAS